MISLQNLNADGIRIIGFIKNQIDQFSPKIDIIELNNPSKSGFLNQRTLQSLRILQNSAVNDGTILPHNAMIVPSSFVGGASTTYFLYFIPSIFDSGMVVRLTLPSQINFLSNLNSYTCRGFNGTDNPNLLCTINRAARQITIQNAFNRTFIKPNFVNISISNLQNPTALVTTDSFKLETYTFFGSRSLDSISKFLTVSFNCTPTCKTCSSDKTKCTSCYGIIPQKYLDKDTCVTSCGGSRFSTSINTCSDCLSPCASCFGSANNCTSCKTGYQLSQNTCKSTSLFKQPYYFYGSGLAAAISVSTLLVKICSPKTNWVQSTVALIAVPEIIGWGFIFYLYFNQTTIFHIITIGAALGIHFVLNIIYGMTHQRLILDESSAAYKSLILEYHCWSTLSIVVAFLLSFKFHLIQMSDFGGARALGGEWSHEVWGIWNMIAVTYMISCYTIFMGSNAYFVLKHLTMTEDWIWLVTCDIAIMSTWVFLLLLVATCRHCADPDDVKPKSIMEVKSGNAYNKIDDKNNSALLEEAFSKFPKPKPPPLNLKTIDKPPQGKRRLNTFEKDLSMTEEEMVGLSSQRGRGNQIQPLQKKESMSEPTQMNSGRGGGRPPTMRNEVPKPLPPPKNDKIKSPENKKQQIEEDKNETQEKMILKQYIDFLNQERVLLKDERVAMMKERQRLMEDERQRQREFMNMQLQLNKNQDLLSRERQELENIRRQFLDEMDNRLKQRLEDWETNSQKKGPRHVPSPPPNPNGKSSTFTYTYTDVSIYDKGIQTEMRRSKVKDMNVQVGIESRQNSMKTLPVSPNNPLLEEKQPIKEYPSEYEETDQHEDLIHKNKNKDPKNPDKNNLNSKDQNNKSIGTENKQPNNRYKDSIENENNIQHNSKQQDSNPALERDENIIPINEPSPSVTPPVVNVVRPPSPVVKGPIQNKPFFKQASDYQQSVQRSDSEMEPFADNRAVFRPVTADINGIQRELTESYIEPPGSAENNPFYQNMPPEGQEEDELLESQVEPIKGNQPHFKSITPNLVGGELDESQMEPMQNKAHFKSVTPNAGVDRSLNESQVEPLKGNNPLFSQLSPSKPGAGEDNRTLNESMIEPLRENRPLYQSLTPNPDIQNERSLNESMIEPIKNNPLFSQVSPDVNKKKGEQSINESMLEPIQGNNPRFSQVTPLNRNDELNESMMEPIQGNHPMHSESQKELLEREMNDSHMVTPARRKPKIVEAPDSHQESGGATPNENPNFEKIPPQLNTKTDDEVQHTEMNTIEENEKVQTLEEMKAGPIAKKVKKILYSDKSESSIDEMMEDTPSNYNIPNGRIEGRSLGLKALLLQDKKRNQRSDPLAIDLKVGPTEAGKTLQPESLNKTLAAAKGGKKQNLSPIKKGDGGLLSPKAQGSGGKVNNLFKDPSIGGIPQQEIMANQATLRNGKQQATKSGIPQKIDVGGMDIGVNDNSVTNRRNGVQQKTNGTVKSGVSANLKKQFTERPVDDETPINNGPNATSQDGPNPYSIKNPLPPPPVVQSQKQALIKKK